MLSADAITGGAPAVVADIWDDPLDDDLHPAEEILFFEVEPPESDTPPANNYYDPSQDLEDLFSGLADQDLSDDDVSDPSETQTTEYTPFKLTDFQQTLIASGLQAFARLGQVIESCREFTAHVPFSDGDTVGSLLGLSEIMDTRLAKPVYDYFNDATDPPDTDQVLTALDTAPGTNKDIQLDIHHIDGGYAAADKEIRFEIELSAERKGEVRLCGTEAGLVFAEEATAEFTAACELDCSFGLDLLGAEEFFIEIESLDATLAVDTTDLDVALKSASTDPELAVIDGTLAIEVEIQAETAGRVTFGQLMAASAENLPAVIRISVSGTLAARLPIYNLSQSTGNPVFTVVVSSGDLFSSQSKALFVDIDFGAPKNALLNWLATNRQHDAPSAARLLAAQDAVQKQPAVQNPTEPTAADVS